MKGHPNRRPDSERIPIADLRKRFEYRDGELIRLKHSTAKGKVGNVNSLGYHRIKIDAKQYLTHHIVFAIVHGRYPLEIDHIDRNKLNNRIENLREVTRKENLANKGDYAWRPEKNIRKRKKGFAACVTYKGIKQMRLGLFDTFAEAVEARVKWMREHSKGAEIV